MKDHEKNCPYEEERCPGCAQLERRGCLYVHVPLCNQARGVSMAISSLKMKGTFRPCICMEAVGDIKKKVVFLDFPWEVKICVAFEITVSTTQ